MRLIILGAAMAATLLGAVPASADSVTIRAGEGGVAVRTGDGYNHHRYRHHYNSGWRNHYAGCRTVQVRTRMPNGNVVVKSRRTCG
jgi:hypothetical protein